MQVATSFDVAAPIEAVWELLVDVPRVIPCMPGAVLESVVDERTWRANVAVKLGPISLRFASDIVREELNTDEHAVRLSVNAKEARGRGGARMQIDSSLQLVDGMTRATIVTEVELRGAVASHGRGVVEEVAREMTNRFAACIAERLNGDGGGQGAAPVGGVGLVLGASSRRLRQRLNRDN